MTCVICGDPIKNMFYTSVGPKGDVDPYCHSCYNRAILDNYTGMESMGTRVLDQKCECGTKNPPGNGHSSWCCVFRKEFS